MKHILLILITSFSFIQLSFGASIEGKAWKDSINVNGLQDAMEPRVPGIRVYLLAHPSGDTLQQTMTDANGTYSFLGLLGGDYLVAFRRYDFPIGWGKIAPTDGWQVGSNCDINGSCLSNQLVLPNDNIQMQNIDLGLQVSPTAILSGMVWEDVNANDIRDAGDGVLQDIYAYLINDIGDTVHIDTTDVAGIYSFAKAEYGDYIVKFDITTFPVNYHPVGKDSGVDDTIDSDVDGSGKTSTIALVGDLSNVDLGLKLGPSTESIGGKVWFDGNNDGLFASGEIGVINVVVRLLDETNIELQKDTTDTNGFYLFDGVQPGNYYIEFDTSTMSSDYVVVSKGVGSDESIDSDAFANGKTDLIMFTTSISNVDMGVYAPPTTGSINGKVWEDADKNNLYAVGESYISGIPVYLISAAGDTTMTLNTDVNGAYTFVNIDPETYKVAFELANLPTGYSISTKDVGTDDGIDCDVDTFGVSSFMTIVAGSVMGNVDMGYSLPTIPVTLTNDTIMLSVIENESVSICVDTMELAGLFDNAHVCTAPMNGEATDFTNNCFTYIPNPNYFGEDEFCVVVCDGTSCDTTIYKMEVVQVVGVPPVALNDVDTVTQGVPAQLMVLANDTLFAPLTSLTILNYPSLGAAEVDTFGFIRYIPEPNMCDETVEMKYEVCTYYGCDTATVEIFLECNNIKITQGFSPNDDGINETFVIKGIVDYPNNTLTIFNRWGVQVMKQEKYDNTWSGYWDDKNSYLPSGTYFYIFDTGDGGRMTGSFEIMR